MGRADRQALRSVNAATQSSRATIATPIQTNTIMAHLRGVPKAYDAPSYRTGRRSSGPARSARVAGMGDAMPHCGGASLRIMSLAMTPAEREAFLAEVHVAVVTVADDDGRGPLAIPLWYDYQPGGEIVLVTDRNSRKTQLIRRAGRVTVCAQTQEMPYRYASVEARSPRSRTPSPSSSAGSSPAATWATRTPTATSRPPGTSPTACARSTSAPSTG